MWLHDISVGQRHLGQTCQLSGEQGAGEAGGGLQRGAGGGAAVGRQEHLPALQNPCFSQQWPGPQSA